ncbi:MAG: hypothetical protein ACI9FO_000094 [Methylophagaceae bacterium]|jgi:uncharacterized protein (DUF2062 family)
MPRKFLKRFLPDHKTMQQHPHLQKFGQRITDPKLWYLNRRSIAGGAAAGLFVGFMPVLGQMFIAVALAIFFRVNLPIAAMGVWITNPLTFAPIYFFNYKVGAWVLDVPLGQYAFTMTWEWFTHEFLAIWQPLLLGSLISGVTGALLAILFVRLLWRLMVIRSWLERKKKATPKD